MTIELEYSFMHHPTHRQKSITPQYLYTC